MSILIIRNALPTVNDKNEHFYLYLMEMFGLNVIPTQSLPAVWM